MKNYKGKKPIKNTQAKIYYRDNIQKEFNVFLKKTNDYIIRNNQENPNKIMSFIKKYWLPILLMRTDKIIKRWFIKTLHPMKKNIISIIQDFIKLNKKVVLKDIFFREVASIIIKRNVNLIRNIASQTMVDLENTITNSLLSNGNIDNLKKNLNIVMKKPQWRIELVAQDQTNKFNEFINKTIQNYFGIEYFVWGGVKDARERPEHNVLNDKIFKWDDINNRLPIIDKKGTRGYPADAVNCRCQALPYIPQGQPVWLGNNKGYQFK